MEEEYNYWINEMQKHYMAYKYALEQKNKIVKRTELPSVAEPKVEERINLNNILENIE